MNKNNLENVLIYIFLIILFHFDIIKENIKFKYVLLYLFSFKFKNNYTY